MSQSKVIGILGAIPEEVNGIIHSLTNVTEVVIGGRKYYKGLLYGVNVVVVYSRIGKVAASVTVSTLLLHFNVSNVVFVGVAGGIHADVRVGDVVVAKDLIQYDMDASPLRSKFEIPLLGQTYFHSEEALSRKLLASIESFLAIDCLTKHIEPVELRKFNIEAPRVHYGTIASGDQFFSTNKQKQALIDELPNVLCVEMEGAAVAQVCYEFGVPFIVIRTISDNANQEASFSFQSFVQIISLVYGREIVKEIVKSI
ncbi:5'-methylthioadenosine/adenosylhomocysteine nucleosidase [Myroides pelagicus]|uniref:5'-methylthioadenosine/adenosylhomocysteine nucleosidase n=1 Tax=Myroides pelagicus TaxID=270914 RepID=UPI002DB8CE80|nr:5'-methylthioadenosine/adenosylhomocysteine nucleosidase [Myroides pelagicus]MEC4113664.1 5'-methylthioadenosine/adenosylhomocysteine nucleosidase [Myroides pelagicus]